MKTIMETELSNLLASHKLWNESNGMQGIRAYLEDADLAGANLKGANLSRADLYRANLCDADLCDADLCDADLWDADLKDADLRDANLTGANLTGTILDKKAEKVEKQTEVASVNAESSIRSEIEAIAKKHGMKIESMTFSLI